MLGTAVIASGSYRRSRSGSFCKINEIYLIGDQLREALQDASLIKNRKYHLRTYRSCIVGKELIDWLVKNKHCNSREAAIDGMKILQQHSLIHHVCDDHEIKDEVLFYRFRRDDDTYMQDKDLSLFYRALELYNGLSTRTVGIIRSYQQDGELYRNAFQGSEFVDYLLREGTVYSREDAVILGRRLLENDTIRHVTDDFHFRDDSRLLYQFTLDFSQRRHLAEVFNYAPHSQKRHDLQTDKASSSRRQFQFHTPKSSPTHSPERVRKRRSTCGNSDSEGGRGNASSAKADRLRSMSGDSGNGTDCSETATEQFGTTRSVLLRHASVDELESPDTPYIKQTIKIQSDPVGYGFVIRGNSPTYVQAVDPMGPAAVAGLKVRQYLYSVNGVYVLRSDHKTVGKLIMQSVSHVTLVVMTHKRDAGL
ncbi:DEP domain-containing mTOR-interacting protein-like isoform X2 [Mercenaria mercenaria]|uniref:DEP domain-containing mTOR-interacting protein-like isoform X2 n=1 Tax=Mercenaria mercenaria TaxID=6596 RepID=UPI00234E3A0D|nr:DEP domain-containing mTOR-interacting protein-like isoform X2 [Mercenaria mercenaria]